jgi:hypothetical protein
MSLLNEGYFPYINSNKSGDSKIDFRKSTFYWTLKDWSDKDYWYCEILTGSAFADDIIYNLIPSKILKRIQKDTKTFLCICNAHESFHSIVLPLYKDLVIKSKIPPEKIILISESADLYLEVKKVSVFLGLKPMNVEWSLIFEKNIQNESYSLDFEELNNTDLTERRFLNLNRRWRLHRPTLVALMLSAGILDKGYVSLAKSDDRITWTGIFRQIENHHKDDEEIISDITSIKDKLLNLSDMYLDTQDLISNKVEIGELLMPYYRKTAFSVVTETNFYTSEGWETGRFLSEKTFKPIAFKHPFIMVSVPHTLSLLRELGYKTFSPFIDEGYDSEFNDFSRMKKIVNGIKRLTSMSEEELKNFKENIYPIVEYNYNWLRSRKNFCFGRSML